jgi:hypothetical protein
MELEMAVGFRRDSEHGDSGFRVENMAPPYYVQ